jgi:hypothetical protein
MKWLLPLLLLPSVAFSQGLGPNEEEYNYPSFRECGLATRWASNIIPPNCLTEAKNVYFDEDLSVYRRRGQAQYNLTPCTDSKAIKGMWKFNATDGQRYVVLLSSQTMFWTKNQGDCTAITGLNNLNADAEVECVQSLGKLWCTNGIDTPFWTTVTSTGTFGYDLTEPSAPTYLYGTKIGTFRNRIVLAGIQGQLSRIRLSGDGNGEDWALKIPGQSTSPASIDISGTHDGKSVKALLGQYQNAYYIGREDDLWGLYGNDRRDFTLRQISNQIGVLESRSVKEKDNCLRWLSRRGVEKMCGTTIERDSDPVRDLIDVIIGATGNTRTKTYTTPEDWEAGLYSTQVGINGPTSTTIYPGSVVPSTWGHVNTEGAQWAAGSLVNIDTFTADGSILISFKGYSEISNTPSVVLSGLSRTVGSGSYSSISGGTITFNGNTVSFNDVYSELDDLSYSKFEYSFPILMGQNGISGSVKTSNVDVYAVSDSATSPSNGYFLRFNTSSNGGSAAPYRWENAYLYKKTAGVNQLLASTSLSHSASCSGLAYIGCIKCDSVDFKFQEGEITATDPSCGLNLSYSTTSFSSDNYSLIDINGDWLYSGSIGAIKVAYGGVYFSSASFISGIYDTTFSTPIGGPYYFDEHVPVGSTVTYQVRESTSNVLPTWSGWVNISTATSGEFRVPLTKRFWQEKISLSTEYSTQTPVIGITSLEATTSGYYIADCVNAAGVTSWGNFRPDTRTSGASVVSYAVNSGDSCNQVTRSTATWLPQIANAPVVASTNTYLGVRFFELPYTTTDTLRVDALTVEWNEGSERPPVAAEVYRDRYYLFYTTNTNAGAYNNSVLVMDSNSKWSFLEGINAYSSVVYENQLMTGDSQNTGLMFIQDGLDVFTDNGSNYDFYIKTNDFDFGNPIEKKVLKRIYLMLRSEEKSGQDIDLTLKYYINGSTTSYSLSSVGLEEATEKGYFVAKFPAINSQPSTFNWLGLSLEYDGEEGPINLYGIKVIYSKLRSE